MYTETGELIILGRVKDVMHYKNHEIYPTDLEEVLLSHNDVLEVAVVPVPHELDGERPMAFIKKVPGSQVKKKNII